MTTFNTTNTTPKARNRFRLPDPPQREPDVVVLLFYDYDTD